MHAERVEVLIREFISCHMYKTKNNVDADNLISGCGKPDGIFFK